MRIVTNGDRRILAASKYLVQHVPDLKLSMVQEALSKALGYRDFHDFQTQHANNIPSELDQQITGNEFHKRWVTIIVNSAKLLNADDGTIQHYLSQTRLTGDREWTLDDHLTIRAHCWLAQGIVGLRGSKYGGFGRIQEDDTQLGEDGYIIKSGKPSAILGPFGFFQCADYELKALNSVINPFIPYSHYIPYGYKPEGDRKIYFGREYFPLWIMYADGKIDRPNPWDKLHAGSGGIWFSTITGEHFLSEKTRALALDSLAQHGISGLPVFANATPAILKSGVTSLSDAVGSLKNQHMHGKSWKPILTKYLNDHEDIECDDYKRVVVAENDWERLLDECGTEHGSVSDPVRYFEHGRVHFHRATDSLYA